MYDVKTLKATPGLARRLLAFSEMNHMTFGPELVELAMTGLIDPQDLEAFSYRLDRPSVASLQHIRDWNGRAMLLCSNNDRARHITLANVWLNKGKTLILAQPKFYHIWAKLIRDAFPDAKISVFGNPRYNEKVAPFPDGVEFKDVPDWEADFFISSYGGVVWHNFFGRITVDQSIIEELDHQNSINYKWQDAVKGMFHEMPKPVFIQNIYNLPNDPGLDNLASLQAGSSTALHYLGQMVGDLMWAGIGVTKPLGSYMLKDVEEYLIRRGYTNFDFMKLLSLYGVSSHLLDDLSGNKAALTFRDGTIQTLLNDTRGKRQESGLYRMINRERELEVSTGQKISLLVQNALDGDRPSETLLGGLMTTQWANLKAQHIKTIHTNVTNRLTHCLFLVDNADLKRALRLQFGPVMEDLTCSTDKDFLVERYIHPLMSGKIGYQRWATMKPVTNLIVSIDDLINEPKLLNLASFLFLSESPLNREYFQGIKAAADDQGTRIVSSVINGTWEEEVFSRMQLR